jgi:hypothetical protein
MREKKIIRRRGNNGAAGVQGCLGELLDFSHFTTRNPRYYTLLVIYIHTHTHTHTCVYTYIRRVCRWATRLFSFCYTQSSLLQFTGYIYVNIYICASVCVCVCACVCGGEGCLGELLDFSHFTARNPRYYTFTRYTHTHTHTHTHIRIYIHSKGVCVCVCVCARARACICSHVCTYVACYLKFF